MPPRNVVPKPRAEAAPAAVGGVQPARHDPPRGAEGDRRARVRVRRSRGGAATGSTTTTRRSRPRACRSATRSTPTSRASPPSCATTTRTRRCAAGSRARTSSATRSRTTTCSAVTSPGVTDVWDEFQQRRARARLRPGSGRSPRARTTTGSARKVVRGGRRRAARRGRHARPDPRVPAALRGVRRRPGDLLLPGGQEPPRAHHGEPRAVRHARCCPSSWSATSSRQREKATRLAPVDRRPRWRASRPTTTRRCRPTTTRSPPSRARWPTAPAATTSTRCSTTSPGRPRSVAAGSSTTCWGELTADALAERRLTIPLTSRPRTIAGWQSPAASASPTSLRRLSMGVHPELARGSSTAPTPPSRGRSTCPRPRRAAGLPAARRLPRPAARSATCSPPSTGGWVGCSEPDRMIEERLVWFWHDHFATSVAKVRVPYLMYQQHLHAPAARDRQLRRPAARGGQGPGDAAASSTASPTPAHERNENFGREVMELFTMGREASYTQDDVVAASRAFTGWVVDDPRPAEPARRLGGPAVERGVPRPAATTPAPRPCSAPPAPLDMDGALDVILDAARRPRGSSPPSCARELVGVRARRRDRQRAGPRPSGRELRDHAAGRGDRAARPRFTSDAAVRAKYRSPVEKLVGHRAGDPARRSRHRRSAPTGPTRQRGRRAARSGRIGYLPFVPPNVGRLPEGLAPARPAASSSTPSTWCRCTRRAGDPDQAVDDLLRRASALVRRERPTRDGGDARSAIPTRRFALVVASPEYTVV